MVSQFVKASDAVWEFGGSIGVVAVTTNKILEPSEATRHVVVEANPLLISFLARNMQMNNAQFVIEYGVVGDKAFYGFNSTMLTSGRVDEGPEGHNATRRFVVPGISIDYLLTRYGNPSVVIMDIEGSEFEFIENFLQRLPSLRCLIVEFHTHVGGLPLVESARATLTAAGLNCVESCFDGTNYTDVWQRAS